MWSRQDMQDAPPDILITNYSMLNIMLMRAIEATIFDQTRTWLQGSHDRVFHLVVDELHTYRGTPGTEVAYLFVRSLIGLVFRRIPTNFVSSRQARRLRAAPRGSSISNSSSAATATASGSSAARDMLCPRIRQRLACYRKCGRPCAIWAGRSAPGDAAVVPQQAPVLLAASWSAACGTGNPVRRKFYIGASVHFKHRTHCDSPRRRTRYIVPQSPEALAPVLFPELKRSRRPMLSTDC